MLEARVRQIEDMARDGRYPSGPVVPAMARAFAAFQRQDFSAAIDAIEPVLSQRERIGGSRTQIDLVEFTLLKAYLDAGRLDDVRRLLGERRPGPTRDSRCRTRTKALIESAGSARGKSRARGQTRA